MGDNKKANYYNLSAILNVPYDKTVMNIKRGKNSMNIYAACTPEEAKKAIRQFMNTETKNGSNRKNS